MPNSAASALDVKVDSDEADSAALAVAVVDLEDSVDLADSADLAAKVDFSVKKHQPQLAFRL